MTALPVVSPSAAVLRRVEGLSEAASRALDVDPRTIIERWLAGLGASARRNYARGLQRFCEWLFTDGEPSPMRALEFLCQLEVGPASELLVRWRDEMLAAGSATGTVAGHLTGVTSLLAACRRAGLVAWKLERVQPRVEQRLNREGPRRGDVERLVAVIDEAAAAGDPHGIRDSALVRLLYCCALRRSEAAQLGIVDVDLAAELVRPRRKGHRERKPVGISAGTVAALRAWLQWRGDSAGPLFFCLRGGDRSQPLSGESIRRLLLKWTRRAGISHRIRPHGLRHSSATEAAKKGSLADLMALGGWSSFSAARRYLDEHAETRRRAMALVDL